MLEVEKEWRGEEVKHDKGQVGDRWGLAVVIQEIRDKMGLLYESSLEGLIAVVSFSTQDDLSCLFEKVLSSLHGLLQVSASL